MADDTNDERATTGVSRRGALALLGLTGVGLLSAGSTTAKPANNVSLTIEDDLDLNGNDLINGDNFWPSSDYASFCTSGSGNGRSQLYDTAAETYFLRAYEGDPADPGPVEFQAPIKGARADSPGTQRPGPLRVQEGAVVDNLSIAGTNRVDVVAEPAIDHTGDLAQEILDYVEGRERIAHRFVLPEGTYRWDTCLLVEGFEYIGIVGKPRATLDVSEQISTAMSFGNWRTGGSKRLELRNLTVDITGQDSAGNDIDAGMLKASIDKEVTVDSLTLRGSRNRAQDVDGDGSLDSVGDKYGVLVNVLDEEGVGYIRNLNMPDGEVENTDSQFDHSIAVATDPPHLGTNVFENCYVEGFVSNAFYMSDSTGQNIIRGCVTKNNGGSNIRIRTNDVCRDSRIIIDNGSEQRTPGCGLWLNGGCPVAENITIDAPEAANDLVRINSDCDGGTVRDVTIRVGPDSNARSIRMTQSSSTNTEPVLLENVTVHDEASSGFSVYARRENVTMRNVNVFISESNDRRQGIYIDQPRVRLNGCRVHLANGGNTVNVSNDEVDCIGCQFEGTGSNSAGFVLGHDVDPSTIQAHACRFDNVYFHDYSGTVTDVDELAN